ncbi:unnamed protein product, partial [Vitis vinifera]
MSKRTHEFLSLGRSIIPTTFVLQRLTNDEIDSSDLCLVASNSLKFEHCLKIEVLKIKFKNWNLKKKNGNGNFGKWKF